MKYIFSIILIIIIHNIGQTQSKYLNINTYFGFQPNKNLVYYYKYESNHIIKPVCKKLINCNRSSPEELLLSMVSSKDYYWDQNNYNFKISSKKNYNEKSSNDEFELLRKLAFSVGNEQYTIVKFYITANNNTSNHALALKLIENKWQVINTEPTLTRLVMMFKYLSMKSLDSIFENEPLGIDTFDSITLDSYSIDTINISKVLNTKIEVPYSEFDNKTIMDLNKHTNSNEKYKEIPVKCKIIFPLYNQNIFLYVDHTYFDSSEDNEINILIDILDVDSIGIEPIYRFNFDYNNHSYSILLYKVNHESINIKEYRVFRKPITDNSEWVLVKEYDHIITDIIKMNKKYNIDILCNINYIMNEQTPESIQQLSQRVKDSLNNVDIIELLEF